MKKIYIFTSCKNNNMELNSEETSHNEEIKPSEDLWDEIGFHRPLGGFWFKVIFILIAAVFGLGIVGFYYKYIYPYPESVGYRTIVGGHFPCFSRFSI